MLDDGDMAWGVQQHWGCLQGCPAQCGAHLGVCRRWGAAGSVSQLLSVSPRQEFPLRENQKGRGGWGLGDTVGLKDT